MGASCRRDLIERAQFKSKAEGSLRVLAGGAFGQDVVRGPASALLWALDVEAFLSRDEFLERMDAQIDQVKQAEPIVGGVELTVPGERGARHAAEHVARGRMPLGAASWQILMTCCQSLGVAPPEVLAA